MPDQKPSIGRVVHYVSIGDEQPMRGGICSVDRYGVINTPIDFAGEHAGEHRAAIITGICTMNEDNSVYLHVMTPAGIYQVDDSNFDPEGKTPGTWHWPERVE